MLERIDHGILPELEQMDLWRISNYADLAGIGRSESRRQMAFAR
jgi:hypothetical protein